MKISAKGRYALAATISLAEQCGNGEYISLINIANKLGISKIYLEQIFSQLKREQLVTSTKGPKGGYQLARIPEQITVMDVLLATETSLFETVEETTEAKVSEIEEAMRERVFDVLDEAVKTVLEGITLADMVSEVRKRSGEQGLMYYI
jgi:Rrf2 family cysteine metabolism transcriptional repressor